MIPSDAEVGSRAPAASVAPPKPVLCVTLETDLLTADLVLETVVATLSRKPGRAFGLMQAARRGEFHMNLAAGGGPDFVAMPWRSEVVAELQSLRETGTRIVLVSRCGQTLARSATRHFGLFDEVLGGVSDPEDRDRRLAARFGAGGFVLFAPPPSDQGFLRAKAAIKALRPHQWVKNILVFVPLVVSGHLGGGEGWLNAFLTFVAFSMTASAIYILNDLSDLDADRTHPRKRFRPLASGALPISWGLIMAPSLLLAGGVIALLSGGLLYLVLYALLSISYSLSLKEKPMVDVFVLAALYTVRLYAGGEVAGLALSVWLLAFSVFIFLGLALMKRMAELVATKAATLKRRGYKQIDQSLLMSAGVACGFGACVVLALYLDSEEVTLVYQEPVRLWLIVPLMLFWQLRLWHRTLHGGMSDDPIVFAAKDRVSWLVGAFMVASAIFAGVNPA